MSNRTLPDYMTRATPLAPPLVAAYQALRERAYLNPETRDLLDQFIARLIDTLHTLKRGQEQRGEAFGDAAYDSEDVEQHERAGRYAGRGEALDWLSSELVFLTGRNVVPRQSSRPLFSTPARWCAWPEPDVRSREELLEERRQENLFERGKHAESEFHAQGGEQREEGGVQ